MDKIVKITDMPPLFCHKGCRAFFARHGLDYVDFLHNGISLLELQKLDDDRVRMLEEYMNEQEKMRVS